MKNIRTFIFSFALIFGVFAHGGSLESGIAAFDKREYVAALELLQPLAEDGDGIAQGYLAVMYEFGMGVERDYVTAASWYLKSADNGDMYSQYEIGRKYQLGVGITKNIDKAISYFLLAANQGFTNAQYALVKIASKSKTFSLSRAKSIEWLTNAANAGNVFAQFDLANILAENSDFESSRLAVHWWKESARQSFGHAASALGQAYSEGFGVLTDLQRAYMWYSIADKNGSFGAKIDKMFWGAKLSSEQRSRADEMADFCVKTKYKEC